MRCYASHMLCVNHHMQCYATGTLCDNLLMYVPLNMQRYASHILCVIPVMRSYAIDFLCGRVLMHITKNMHVLCNVIGQADYAHVCNIRRYVSVCNHMQNICYIFLMHALFAPA